MASAASPAAVDPTPIRAKNPPSPSELSAPCGKIAQHAASPNQLAVKTANAAKCYRVVGSEGGDDPAPGCKDQIAKPLPLPANKLYVAKGYAQLRDDVYGRPL